MLSKYILLQKNYSQVVCMVSGRLIFATGNWPDINKSNFDLCASCDLVIFFPCEMHTLTNNSIYIFICVIKEHQADITCIYERIVPSSRTGDHHKASAYNVHAKRDNNSKAIKNCSWQLIAAS